MKIQKVMNASGEFAKKGEDINDGDMVTIKSEGEWIEGQFGQQFVIKVETKNGEKNVNFNATTRNILHDEFGDETSEWINKEVLIRTKKDNIGGRKVEIYYFVTPEWDFDEYGDLVKVLQQ
jgi:predicted lipoprotein